MGPLISVRGSACEAHSLERVVASITHTLSQVGTRFSNVDLYVEEVGTYRKQFRCTICARTLGEGRVDVASIRTRCDDAVASAIAQMRCAVSARAA